MPPSLAPRQFQVYDDRKKGVKPRTVKNYQPKPFNENDQDCNNPFLGEHLDVNDEANPFLESEAIVTTSGIMTRSKASSSSIQGLDTVAGRPKENGKKALASKSTNHPPRPLPSGSMGRDAMTAKFEIAIPVRHAVSQLPPAKRTKLAGYRIPATPQTSKQPQQLKMPKRPRSRKFRHTTTGSSSMKRLGSGIGAGDSVFTSLFGSSDVHINSTSKLSENMSKSNKPARNQKVAHGPCIPKDKKSGTQVISMGNIDTVIDASQYPTVLVGSSPPSSWFREKASGVVSGAKKAADRFLRGGTGKGYEHIDDELLTSKMSKKGASKKFLNIGKTKQNNTECFPGMNTFGEFIDGSSSSTINNSFNSFLLKDEDELSLQNGSYIVNYSDSDTVITGLSLFEPEPEIESPLAQFTPKIGWQLRRKKGFSFLKQKPTPVDGGDGDATIEPGYAEDNPGEKDSLKEADSEELSDDELTNSDYNISHSSLITSLTNISGRIVAHSPHKSENTKKVVKKMGRSNLRAGTASRKQVYGKKVVKAPGKALRGMGSGWLSLQQNMNAHSSGITDDDGIEITHVD